MKLAELYSRDQQWAEAVDRLNQVLNQSPSDDVLLDAHLGWRRSWTSSSVTRRELSPA